MVPDDQIRLISALSISIPLSFLIPYLPTARSRYIYSFVVGTALQYYVYGTQLWLNFLQHLIVYMMMKIVGRKCGKIITIYTVLSIFIYHIYRMVIDYGGWKLDISTIMMTMVCRYSLLAYAYEDGGNPPQTKKQHLSKQQKQMLIQRQTNALLQLPGLMSYLGYCQFLPTSITGTAFEYKHFSDYMGMRNGFEKTSVSWKLMILTLLQSIIYVAVYIGANQMYFPIDYMKEDQFINQGFWFILLYSYISIETVKCKYYFGWKLSMVAIHASNFSSNYNPETKQDNHDKIDTVNVVKVIRSIHVQQKIQNWNISVQVWLKKCVYQRANFKNKMHSKLITFLTSAFWHGVYIGYYFSFVMWFLQVHLSYLIFKYSSNTESKLIKLYNKLGIAGYVLLWIICNFIFNHTATYFMVLKGSICIKILERLYFFVPIGLITLIFIFTFLKKSKDLKKSKKHIERKQQQKHD